MTSKVVVSIFSPLYLRVQSCVIASADTRDEQRRFDARGQDRAWLHCAG
jgi:hypothetical protein